jgi:hypothetical protein
MAEIFNIADHQTITTKLVCSSCGAPGEGSCRCGVSYINPSDQKEQRKTLAKKLYGEGVTMEQIAAQLGVSQATISGDLGNLSKTDKSKSTKTARNPKGAGRPKGAKSKPSQPRKPVKADQEDRAREIVRPLVAAGESIDYVKLGKQHGIAHVTVEKAARIETVLLHETTDIDTLPKTAKDKLEIAKRMLERKLNAEHALRMRGLDEEVRQRVLAEGKEYLADLEQMRERAYKNEKFYRELINDRKPLFTADQFRHILMCLHPDGERTATKLAEAFRLFNDKKLQLTGSN